MNPVHDRPHDRLAKFAFGRTEGARALLEFALPPVWREHMDLASLRVLSENPIGDQLSEGLADLLFEVRGAKHETILHLLVEHKSSAERFTLLELFESCGRLWGSWRSRNPRARTVPRILPILLHHGHRPWAAPRTVAGLLAGGLELARTLSPFDPVLPIVLVDLVRVDDSDFDAVACVDAFAGTALWMLRWSRTRDFVTRLIARADLLQRVLQSAGGSHHFNQLLHYAITTAGRNAIDVDLLFERLAQRLPNTARLLMRTMADELIERGMKKGLEQGREQGREQGIGLGRTLGLRASIQTILGARFGAMPEDLVDAITRIDDPTALEALLKNAATAQSLEAFASTLSA